jgi:phenylacetic acid degradation operon negative regulatory protein
MPRGEILTSQKWVVPEVRIDLGRLPSTPANSFIREIGVWFARERTNWLAAATWVSLLSTLGIVESTSRTALHRMTREGLLRREARGGRPGYGLSEETLQYLRQIEEDERTEASSDHAWAVVTFSIPTEQRSDRHALRTVLARHGFASLGNGVWVAPLARLSRARLALRASGFAGRVEIFRSDYDGFGGDDEFASRHWDINALAGMYRDFISDVRRRLRRKPAAEPGTFADVVLTINTWRRINFDDPGLPDSALPRDWPREEARLIHDELVNRSLESARDYVDTVERRS